MLLTLRQERKRLLSFVVVGGGPTGRRGDSSKLPWKKGTQMVGTEGIWQMLGFLCLFNNGESKVSLPFSASCNYKRLELHHYRFPLQVVSFVVSSLTLSRTTCDVSTQNLHLWCAPWQLKKALHRESRVDFRLMRGSGGKKQILQHVWIITSFSKYVMPVHFVLP